MNWFGDDDWKVPAMPSANTTELLALAVARPVPTVKLFGPFAVEPIQAAAPVPFAVEPFCSTPPEVPRTYRMSSPRERSAMIGESVTALVPAAAPLGMPVLPPTSQHMAPWVLLRSTSVGRSSASKAPLP